MSIARVALREVAPAKPLKIRPAGDDLVWHLNLDQVEANSGRVLEENLAPASEAGNSTHWFDENHVLYSKLRPYLNKVVVPEKKGVATTELVPLRPDPKRLVRRYLAYYLRSDQFVNWVNVQVAGAKMPRVSMKVFWEHEIPLPPLPEQRRIAAILDKADAIRRKRQQAIRLTEEFLRSVFLDMFGDPVLNPKGWEVVSLGEIGLVQGGLQVTPKRAGNPIEVPYLRVANVYRDRLDLNEIKKIQITKAELERIRLQRGDMLMVEGHGNPSEIGRSAIWDGSIDDCVHQNHLIRVRMDKKYAYPVYVSTYLNSPGGRRQLFRHGKTTSGLNTISTSNVKSTSIVLPPLKVQGQFLEVAKSVKVNGRKMDLSLEEQNYLFNSLVQCAFRGNL